MVVRIRLTYLIAGVVAMLGVLQTTLADEDSPNAFDRAPLLLHRHHDNTVAVRVDGRVSEASWNAASSITDFRLINRDTENMRRIELATTVRAFYNDKGLYFSFDMDQDEETFVKIHSAPDGGSLNRDFVTVALDTSGEGKYGFYFTLFLGGSKRDGVLQPENDWQSSWDGAWHGRTSHHKGGWSAEFFIPWSILNMPHSQSDRTIGLFVSRRVAGVGEYYAWPAIHSSHPKFLSDFHPIVVQDIKPRQQLSIIPFVATTMDTVSDSNQEHAGVDLFWRPTSNFQLTATALPDFGTVEADDVIINLTVFETFFPDKRLFFTEGQQVFLPQRWSNWGASVPFHSRRIGDRPSVPSVPPGVRLDYSRLSQGTDLLGAVKGVGQWGNWRYGALAAWEDDASFGATLDGEPLAITVPGRDFSVMRLVYEGTPGGSLRLGALSTARWDQTGGNAYSHTFDSRYVASDGNFGAEAQVFVSNVTHQATGFGGFAEGYWRSHSTTQHNIRVQFTDENLNLNAMGYNSRNDQAQLTYNFFHMNLAPKKAQSIGTGFGGGATWNTAGERTATAFWFNRNVRLRNQSRVGIGVNLDPSHLNDTIAYQVEKFRTNFAYSVAFDWGTDNSKKLYYAADCGYRKEIIEGSFVWTGAGIGFQPTESLRLAFRLSKGFRDGWLRYRGGGRYTRFESWGPSAILFSEYSIGPRQQIRLDMQWQTIQGKGLEYYNVPAGTTRLTSTGHATTDLRDDFSISQMTVQLRYRWEIAPMSDVYLVYTQTASRSALEDNRIVPTLQDLFEDSDTRNIAAKVRYRFGS